MLILKGSRTFQGQLIDLSGADPLQVVFSTDGGEQRFSTGDVGRIYLARPPGYEAKAPEAETTQEAPPAAGIAVPANVQWTSVNMAVRQGERLVFRATGQIQISGDAADVSGPAGSTTQRYASGAPLPNALAGALVARIGSGAPFPIGDQTQPLTMPGTGNLMLGINDAPVGDNQGEFRVVIARFPGR